MFVVLAVAALISSVPRLLAGIGFFQRNRINSLMAQQETPISCSLGAFDDDGFEEVVSTRFRLPNRPNTYLSVGGLENHSRGKLNHVTLRQIGNIRFVQAAEDHMSWRDEIDIGRKSSTPTLSPVLVRDLDELIQNYDKLLEHFRMWPDRDAPGRVALDDGTVKIFYKVDDTGNRRARMHDLSITADVPWQPF